MSGQIVGRIVDPSGREPVGGLAVEALSAEFLIARAQEPTDAEGRFRLELPDRRGARGPTTLTLEVRRADGTAVPIGKSGEISVAPDAETLTVELTVEAAAAPASESLDVVTALLAQPLPEKLRDDLSSHGIRTLADVRIRGLEVLGEIPAENRPAAEQLMAFARLDVVSTDVTVTKRLVDVGVTGATALADAPQADIVARSGLLAETVADLQDHARTFRTAMNASFADAVIATAPVNAVHAFNAGTATARIFRPHLPPAPDPDACETCSHCSSAMSPAAYLIDLIDFLIDNFGRVIATSPTVQPTGFPNLAAIEKRLYRPVGSLVADCHTIEDSVRQIELAIEVLERYVFGKTALAREDLYKAFTFTLAAGPRFPFPDAVSDMFDIYLAELGIERADFDAAVKDAYPAAGAPNLTKLNGFLAGLGVTKTQLESGLGLGTNYVPGVKALDWLPTLVRTAATNGLDSNDVQMLAPYQDALQQADAAVGRVKDAVLPEIRANLISYAIYPITSTTSPRDPAIRDTKALARYLHIPLEVDSCARTTHFEDAIEAIQSWVEAFRTGREDPGYFLMFAGGPGDGDFDARWAWLKSYSIWQAAQSIFLYAEDFLYSSVRRDASKPFGDLLKALDDAETDTGAIDAALAAYRKAVNDGTPPDPGLLTFSSTSHGLGLKSFHNAQVNAYASVTPTRLPVYDEWYFFVPLAIADHLSSLGAYEEAANWLHSVFYPFAPDAPGGVFPPVRLVWAGFSRALTDGYAYRNTAEWLEDPFNPFAVAKLREGAFLRHTILRYVENLLDRADAEFAGDTSESLRRAREFYELADSILAAPELPPEDACRAAWSALLAEVVTHTLPVETLLLFRVLGMLEEANGRLKKSDLAQLTSIVKENKAFADRANEAKQLVDQILARPTQAKTIATLLTEQQQCYASQLQLEDDFNRNGITGNWARVTKTAPEAAIGQYAVRKVVCGFCVPANPSLAAARFRISSNLQKLNTCRNFAGMRRAVPTYAPAADARAVVQLTAAGEAPDEAVPSEPPPVFRFSYLVERARTYAETARQLENQLLNAFEQEDTERYNLAKARQDALVATANQSLQDVKVRAANDGASLAQDQRVKAQTAKFHYDDLLRAGLLPYEREAIARLWTAHDWQYAATITGGIGSIGSAIGGAIVGAYYGGPPGAAAGAVVGGIAGAIAGGGQVMRDIASINSFASQARSLEATYQRREQEWQLQAQLARADIQIGTDQVAIANDNVDIATQESAIARLQGQYTSEVVEFLGAKFLNAELWAWMGRLLRGYYRTYLDAATVTARMAQRALEFERQETLTFIAPHYGDREKRDLLGAEQLVTDIARLDEHRLTTERRRKELTRTISLARLDPIGFGTLQQAGFMTFATPMSLFDRDFPGHFLRLIKDVSVTVVALVPSSEGIRATLSNAGLSRVIVGPPYDAPRVIQRQPESVALTAAANATGLFELKLDDPILLPFEGAGVDTVWTLEMPKGANRFDFSTLVDVLFTVRYSANDDVAYRNKVLKQLGISSSGQLPAGAMLSFPLRTAAPDEWFDLFHPQFADPSNYGFGPGQIKPPYVMQFELRRGDFPPNEDGHTLTRINVALRQSRTMAIPLELWFRPADATEEYALDANYTWDLTNPASGPISVASFARKRTGPAAAWQAVSTPMAQLSPFGTWRLRIRNEAAAAAIVDGQEHNQNKLVLDWLDDTLFAVSYDANVEYRYADAAP
jgi:Tc toxin complex TcA C-terminal TcB-binding domain